MTNNNFKIIALRILPGCAAHIRKCLIEDSFYYLCNDYNISRDGKTIVRRSKHLSPVGNDFFETDGECRPYINLSAIAGKNGDGKSSLIELMVRLLNNCAKKKQLDPDKGLFFVKGVRAEFYYMINEQFYCLKESSDDEIEIYGYVYEDIEGVYVQKKALSVDKIRSNFFYTMVSNYSHYAYNTEELDREDNSVGSDEDHWLHNVFHKNDGYQAPLSLHPYRNRGNIDINRERELSKQRVLMTFSQAYSDNPNEGIVFNGKKAEKLRLTDIGYSKLQEVTLKQFFVNHKGIRLLQGYLDLITDEDDMHFEKSDKLISLLISASTSLREAYNKYLGHKTNKKLYDSAKSWMISEGLLEANTDLNDIINLLRNSQDLLSEPEQNELIEVCDLWMPFASLSWIQIQRIELLDDICDIWRTQGLRTQDGIIKIDVNPECIFKPYNSLASEEKCIHYMIYKTLSIFEKHSYYENPCQIYSKMAFFFDGKKPGLPITIDSTINQRSVVPFSILASDWNEKSHVTLKLRQTYNYYKQSTDSTKSLYGEINDQYTEISFDTLNTEQKLQLARLECMPPAIFYWDIYFRKPNDKELLPLDTFSSGEKQKLFSQSAIIYHLQNINSIGSNLIRYKSVNLIMEEIELYYHPEWQRTFSFELMKMIRQAKIQNVENISITYVTHSPYILSDIPKSNVLFLRDGQPDYSMQENTFGSNINGLLKNGFFLPSLPMGEFAHQKINDMFAKLHSGDFDKNELPRFYAEIMTIGEPAIRHQLLTLFNSYKQLNEKVIMKAVETYLQSHHNSDKNDSNQ